MIALISRAFKLPSNTLGMCAFGRTRRSRSNPQSACRGEDGESVLLPVDAKFPREAWEGLEDAQVRGDPAPTPCDQILPLLLPLQPTK
jgi:hypothetical protein